MRESPFRPPKLANPFAWLWEPFEEDPTFILRSMFGAKAVYLDGKIIACFFAKTDPWRGLLLRTERMHHPSLMRDYPGLTPHPILGKWLYLPETHDHFERTAENIVQAALRRDPRIGVIPEPKKKKKKSAGRPQ